jgi:uncharacterized protein YjhX (UPF0386 family)
MKKTIFIMTIAAGVLVAGCKQEPKEYVYLGQLYNTWGHAGQEKIKGKVKEFKQTNFWAAEENGKVVKGKILTIEDRKSLANMGGDFTEEYNESGTVLRSTSFNENGKVLQDVKTTAEGKILLGSEYYMNDTLMANVKYKYEGNNLIEGIAYNPLNDTVFMTIKYEYDPNGYIIKTQSFNYKGEPQGYTILTRNENGQVVKVHAYTKDGKLNSQTDYTYNDKSERIAQHQQIFTTKVVIDYTFTYEYDKMGNYTAIIFQKDGKPLVYRAREIKYYD